MNNALHLSADPTYSYSKNKHRIIINLTGLSHPCETLALRHPRDDQVNHCNKTELKGEKRLCFQSS